MRLEWLECLIEMGLERVLERRAGCCLDHLGQRIEQLRLGASQVAELLGEYIADGVERHGYSFDVAGAPPSFSPPWPLLRQRAGCARRRRAGNPYDEGVPVTLDTISDVFAEQLGDLRSAEAQLLDALPKMVEAASSPALKDAFKSHLDQTFEHSNRIQEIISSVDFSVPQEQCEAMKGLIAEGEKVIKEGGDGRVKDVALIAAAQRVEHYEIAAYGTARTLADQLGLGNAKRMLDDTLDEESQTDKLLTKLATGGILGTGINRLAEL